MEGGIKALLPACPQEEPVARGRGCQWGRQKLSRARFPGGVQMIDTACRHPHGPAVVCSVCRSLNYVLSGEAAALGVS